MPAAATDTTKPVTSTPASPSCPSRTREDEPRANAPRRSSRACSEVERAALGRRAERTLDAHALQDARRPAGCGLGDIAISVRCARLGRVMGLRSRPCGPLRARQRRARCGEAEVRATSPRPRCALTFCSIPTVRSRKHDRYLLNLESGKQRTVGHLDLEHIPLRSHATQIDRFEHTAMDAFESAGQIANIDPQDQPRVQPAAAADQPAQQSPVAHAAARHVAGSEHEIGRVRGLQQVAEVRRVVREVGVHLDDELGAAVERVRKPGQVCLTETGFCAAVQHLDARRARSPARRRSLRCRPATRRRRRGSGTRRRRALQLCGRRANDRLDVGRLVVRWHYDPDRRLHGLGSVVGGAADGLAGMQPTAGAWPECSRPPESASCARGSHAHGRRSNRTTQPATPATERGPAARRQARVAAAPSPPARARAGGARRTCADRRHRRRERVAVATAAHQVVGSGARILRAAADARRNRPGVVRRQPRRRPRTPRSTARSRTRRTFGIAGSQHREIALTFDDGPGPYTPQVLAALQQANAPATFFEVGVVEHYFHCRRPR